MSTGSGSSSQVFRFGKATQMLPVGQFLLHWVRRTVQAVLLR